MLKKLALGAAALALCFPAGAASAQGFDYYFGHAQDHAEHGDFHDEEAYAHARAHEEGFYSPGEHARWHENAERAHEAFHDDHPDTWHDHYDGGGHYGGGYGGYSNYGGYYPYQGYYQSRRHYYRHRSYRQNYWGY